jgi:soluble cytochrome b562
VCFALLLCVCAASAQNAPPANPEQQLRELMMKQMELRHSLGELERKLSLENDKDIIALRKVVDDAQKAVDEKRKVKIAQDPEMQKIQGQLVDERELHMKYREAERKLNLENDKDILALQEAVAAARKALDDKRQEKIGQDPEGKKILSGTGEEREKQRSFRDVERRLRLEEDKDILALQKAVDAARHAVDEKRQEKIKQDPEAKKLQGEIEKQRELHRSFMESEHKLNLENDKDIIALRKAVDTAEKALEVKRKEKISQDPEGKKILSEMGKADAELKSLREKERESVR